MKKLIILVSGKMKSGKNTFAEIMQKELISSNIAVETDYFAKDLKNGCKEDFQMLKYNLNNYVNNFLKLLTDKNLLNEDLKNELNKLRIEDDNWFEDKTFITRAILQCYGTEIFKNRVKETYWVDKVRERCELSKSNIIIITDLRFPDEIEYMYSDSYDLITVRLERNVNKSNKNPHISETSLDNYTAWNYIIDNKRNSVKSFEKQVSIVTKDILSIFS